MRMDQDSARIGFPPPLVYLGILLLGFAWTSFTGTLGPAGMISIVTGGVFILAGALVIVAGTGRFRRAKTHARPWMPSTSLVTNGIYRSTRNPMYLGMAGIYAGLAIVFNSFTAFILLPVVLILIRFLVIAREERYLLGKFGADYIAYKKEVPRWF